MGFYAPAQLVSDARKHGVEVRPIDINLSAWDNTLEELSGKYCALRLGFRQVKGLREEDMQVLLSARRDGFASLHHLHDAGVSNRHWKSWRTQMLSGLSAWIGGRRFGKCLPCQINRTAFSKDSHQKAPPSH
ncbi:hypothetical protein LWM68_08440 [Niabella sp. W65]|nr:hypothetical protein [Niabella sp. W65]MCH7362791.1 hypothetical protein [Niabella sp. W65]ULT46389.1 hypothetical protein KRR40_27120 [Niabella sp. I65]